jgi:hypothetical protein
LTIYVYAELKKELNKIDKMRFNQVLDGPNMEYYSDLPEISIQNLIGKKQKIGVASLFSKRGTTMQKEFFDGMEDFELVTFLVLK